MSRDQEQALIAEATRAVLELRRLAEREKCFYSLDDDVCDQLQQMADNLEAALGSEFTAELAKGFC